MNDSASGEPQWLPVSSAVKITGVTERTLYRWIQSRRLPSRTEDGVVKVELGAVRAIAAERPRANGRSAAGNAAGTAAGSGSLAAEDGAVASRLFGLFESGAAPTEVVQRECLPPKLVLEAFRAFTALKELGNGSGRPSLETRVAALENGLEELANGAGENLARLQRLECHVAKIPVPTAFLCPNCGSEGHVGIELTCMDCGDQGIWSSQR